MSAAGDGRGPENGRRDANPTRSRGRLHHGEEPDGPVGGGIRRICCDWSRREGEAGHRRAPTELAGRRHALAGLSISRSARDGDPPSRGTLRRDERPLSAVWAARPRTAFAVDSPPSAKKTRRAGIVNKRQHAAETDPLLKRAAYLALSAAFSSLSAFPRWSAASSRTASPS